MIYQFDIVSYDPTHDDRELMEFKLEPGIDSSLLATWGSSMKRGERWTHEAFHPTLTLISGGPVPDFIKIGMIRFPLASMRAIEIMERHGVNMQTFSASVQLKKNEPPVSDAYVHYRLLDVGPVIDLKKTETWEHTWRTYFRNPVPTESFLQSDSVMMRDERYKSFVFIKQALKDDFERAGLLGWDFKPFDQVEYWNYIHEREERGRAASPDTPPSLESAPKVANNNIQALELSANILEEVRHGQQVAAQNLDLSLEDDPKTIVEAVAQAVEDLSRQTLSNDDLLEHAVNYGCLFGEQIVRKYGWMWRMVQYSEGSEPALGVVPSDYAYVVHPTYIVRRFLTDPEIPNTMILQFNMLGAEDSFPKPRQKNGFRGLM